jgi:uroporphyrinogen decarboxylase
VTSRERIRAIVAGEAADRAGFWLGNPHPDTWPILHRHLGTGSEEEARRLLGDDVRWLAPWDVYRHPEGKPVFDMRRPGATLGEGGVFAECVRVEDVEAFDWPDPDHLVFDEFLEVLARAGDVYRASGFWSPFFHEVCDFMGMESYFVKMFTHPDVVHAITRHVVDFWLEANRRLFSLAGDEIDGFFFGNDFGSQRDLLITPDQFDEFVRPYFADLTSLGHEHGRQVILHSCGSIHRVIPDLIDMGVDALHPLQARAAGMDADTLRRDFHGRLAFVGGIDTQDLLVNGSPEEVRADVHRVIDRLGPRVVISPSHEAILPNVPPENVVALARAATGDEVDPP